MRSSIDALVLLFIFIFVLFLVFGISILKTQDFVIFEHFIRPSNIAKSGQGGPLRRRAKARLAVRSSELAAAAPSTLARRTLFA